MQSPPPTDTPPVAQAKQLAPLAACLVVLAGLYAWLYHLDPAPPPPRDRALAYPIIFALYLFSAWWIWRMRDRPGGRMRLTVVLAGSLALHAVVLTGQAPPNPDLGRHLWEGRVLLEGHNPYAAPPEAAKYEHIREDLRARGDDLWSGDWLQHKHIRTVYGPVATALWAVPHLLPVNRVLALRLMMTLASLGTVALLIALLGTLNRPPGLAIIYAWSPVCLNGFADRGQIDAVMVLLVVLAALLLARKRPAWAGVAMAGALLTKLWPLLLLLPMLRAGGRRFAAGLVLTGLAGVTPFVGAGPEALEGLGAFADNWHANDSAFTLLLMAAEGLNLPSPGRLARGAAALLALAYALWRTWRMDRGDPTDLPRALAGISAAVVILSPVTYPWYTAPLVAFLCVAPSAWLLALSLAPMGWYLRFVDAEAGVWATVARWGKKGSQLWRLPVYAAVYALALGQWLAARLRGGRGSGGG